MLRQAVWWILRGYQLTLSSFMGRTCRFEPSCSHYAQEAVMTHGVVRGGWLAIKRVGRCNPWGGSGFDPVPQKLSISKLDRSKRHAVTSSQTQGKSCPCCKH